MGEVEFDSSEVNNYHVNMNQDDLKQIREVFRDEFKMGFREGFDDVWKGNLEPALNNLLTGQEDIKLRLDNAAWRFELVALQERVEVLEGKLGIEPKKR